MTLSHPHEQEQVSAIKYTLETAPKVQKQLKEKFGYGENMFFDLDLIEYRTKNYAKDIAEDLDVKSLYGVSEGVAEHAVCSAFRGYDSEEFLPEFQFEGLFGKQLNDIIEYNKYKINGQKNYANGLGKLTAEERSKLNLKAVEARGDHIWSLDELVSLHKIRKESVGKGHDKTRPCWNYVTEKFNEQHGTDLGKTAVSVAYSKNKHILSEAGFEIAEPFWSLDKILSLHEIREESVGKGHFKKKPCRTYTTEKFNERHGTDFTKIELKTAYSRNKHRLSEAGVEIAEPFIWNLDKILSLHEIREESFGKGNKKTSPFWTYVTEEFNEQHGTDFTKHALRQAYSKNKQRLSEAGVEIAEPFSWNLDKILSLHKIRKESFGKGHDKTRPCWNYVTEKFNEQHGTDLGKTALNTAYWRNKHILSEEE